jgi:hypothetical protein
VLHVVLFTPFVIAVAPAEESIASLDVDRRLPEDGIGPGGEAISFNLGFESLLDALLVEEDRLRRGPRWQWSARGGVEVR